MNSANPFQVPTIFQNEAQRRSRERFKKGVVATIVAVVLLIVGLLIQGCKSERSAAITPLPQTAANSQIAVPEQKPNSISPVPQSNPAAVSQLAPTVPKTGTTAAMNPAATIYVVKSGDTLTRIAKSRGITVKSLKSANDLAGDRIAVGEKLKIPQV